MLPILLFLPADVRRVDVLQRCRAGRRWPPPAPPIPRHERRMHGFPAIPQIDARLSAT
jgi:hypothetical protein